MKTSLTSTSSPRTESGFTVSEAMVGLTIFAIVLICLVGIVRSAAAAHLNSSAHVEASNTEKSFSMLLSRTISDTSAMWQVEEGVEDTVLFTHYNGEYTYIKVDAVGEVFTARTASAEEVPSYRSLGFVGEGNRELVVTQTPEGKHVLTVDTGGVQKTLTSR